MDFNVSGMYLLQTGFYNDLTQFIPLSISVGRVYDVDITNTNASTYIITSVVSGDIHSIPILRKGETSNGVG